LASFFSFGFSNTIDNDEEDSTSDRAESCETVNACAAVANPAISAAGYFIVRLEAYNEKETQGKTNELNRSLLRSERVVWCGCCGVDISRHTKTSFVRRREAEKKDRMAP
jgi:hypothetical protein